MSSTLVICLIISLFAVISYVWGKIPMALTAVISLVAFVLFGCLKPEEALGYFGNANGIMIMSMFVVAAGLQRTQFVKKVANSVNSFAKGSIVKVMAGYVIISVILSQFIQSPMIVFGIMAPMMIFIPIAIQACKSMNANPVGIIIMVQAACLTAFMTPMATPAVPMIMAEGDYSFGDMVKQSLIPAAIFCIVTVLWTMTVFPLYA